MEDNKIKVTTPDNNTLEVEVLDIFSVVGYEGKDYILYSLGEEIDAEHEQAYVSVLKQDNDNYSLEEITDEKEWELVQKAIEEDISLSDKILILDNVQDPGNLGTIIRSAKAFNINTIVLSLNCVNKYNEKVIRAAQGMLFKVNVVTKDLKYFIPYLKSIGYDVYGTDVVDGVDVKEIDKKDKIAVVMGNEGQGIEPDIKKLIDKNIYIKMSSDCESLNVAVASSIIMYELN